MELIHAQIFFRHGRRTPSFDWKMYTGADKFDGVVDGKHAVGGGLVHVRVLNPDTGLELVGEERAKIKSPESKLLGKDGKATMIDSAKDFEMGDLTTNGALDALALGQRLRARYVDAGLVVPGELAADLKRLEVVSTPTRRTIDTAVGVLTGLTELNHSQTKDAGIDVTVTALSPLKNWFNVMPMPTKDPDMQEVTNRLKLGMMEAGSRIDGLNEEVPQLLVEMEELTGFKVPAVPNYFAGRSRSSENESPSPVSLVYPIFDELNYLIREGKIEAAPEIQALTKRFEILYSTMFNGAYVGHEKGNEGERYDLVYAGLRELWRQSLRRLDAAVEGSGPKIFLCSGHDSSLIPMLIHITPEWADSSHHTDYCTDIAIELWKSGPQTGGRFMVRTLLSGEPLCHRFADAEGYCSMEQWKELLQPSLSFKFRSELEALQRTQVPATEVERVPSQDSKNASEASGLVWIVAAALDRYTAGTLIDADGTRCRTHTWSPWREPIATAVIYHGYGSHGRSPNSVLYLAELLVSRGIVCYSMDFPGHGQSENTPGLLPSAEKLSRWALRLWCHATEQRAGMKTFLCGTSTGGAVCINLSRQLHPQRPGSPIAPSGAILLAPMVRISRVPPTWQRMLLTALSKIAPEWALIGSNASDPSANYADADRRAEELAQEKYRGKVRLQTALTLQKTAGDVEENLAAVTVPMLIIHGTEDQVVEPEGSRELYSKAASKDKTLKLVEGGLHGLMCETLPRRREIELCIMQWLDQRLTT